MHRSRTPVAQDTAAEADEPAPEPAPTQLAGVGEELDLSDEWEAIAAEASRPKRLPPKKSQRQAGARSYSKPSRLRLKQRSD